MVEKRSAESVAFGRALRALRRSLELSQNELAVAAGVHRTYVGGVERGERNPTLATIFRISEALGVNPAEILELTAEHLGVTEGS